MKIFVKLMILALILSYASLFIIRKPDGTPIQSLDNLVPSFDFSGIGNSITESLEKVSTVFTSNNNPETAIETDSGIQNQVQEKVLYRWQDEHGVWNYTDTPPPGVDAEVMALEAPTVMNLNPTLDISSTETETVRSAENSTETVLSAESESSLIPERIRQMQETIQSAEEVTSQFQEKLEEQQRILDEL